MTEEQIIQIALKHFLTYDEKQEEQLIEFAKEIYIRGSDDEWNRMNGFIQ